MFFLYCRLERDKIKDQYPNENLGDVTKLLGQKWKSLTKDEKQVNIIALSTIFQVDDDNTILASSFVQLEIL